MGAAYEKVDTGIVGATGLSAIPTSKGEAEGKARTRDVYSVDDVKHFDRAVKVLTSHGDKIQIRCGAELCPDRVVQLVSDATAERGAVLRCGCTDRVFSRDEGAKTKQGLAAARRLRRGQARIKR